MQWLDEHPGFYEAWAGKMPLLYNVATNACCRKISQQNLFFSQRQDVQHGSAMEGYYPHELIVRYEVCQIKGTYTLIGVSELTLEKSYQSGLLRIRPLYFWPIK